MSQGPLAGIGILITRPAPLAAGLADAVTALGGTPILFPAVEIAPPSEPARLEAALASLPKAGLAIFVSPTAVAQALPRILAAQGRWPVGTRVAAVGKGTARALASHGLNDILTHPEGADSEHLLMLPQLEAVAGMAVLILRGEGGRELLADTLSERGALVSHAECYRRLPPSTDPGPLLGRIRAGDIGAVTVTSGELLTNLIHALGEAGSASLRQIPMFVTHARIALAARDLGVSDVTVTGAGDAGLLDGLVERFGHV